MIMQDVAVRDRKCHLCDEVIKAGEPCIFFTSAGIGSFTTNNNLCISCCRDFVNDYDKKMKE